MVPKNYTRDKEMKKARQNDSIFEGWNFNSGNYFFTDTK